METLTTEAARCVAKCFESGRRQVCAAASIARIDGHGGSQDFGSSSSVSGTMPVVAGRFL